MLRFHPCGHPIHVEVSFNGYVDVYSFYDADEHGDTPEDEIHECPTCGEVLAGLMGEGRLREEPPTETPPEGVVWPPANP